MSLPTLYIDLRPAEQFAVSRIPGAVHLDLWGVSLIDTDEAPLRAFMWMIGHLFGLRGVAQDRPVVVYESDSGLRAARALWFLEYLGHPNATLLDGGFQLWKRQGNLVEPSGPTGASGSTGSRGPAEPGAPAEPVEPVGPAAPIPSDWHGDPDASKIASWKYVYDRLGKPDTAIVDTRSEAEHYGDLVRARRGGSIPGAVNLEWKQNLAPDGRFKSPEELRAMYEAIGVTPDREVITYCQGGYRAAHTYLALKRAGFTNVRNYTGSWKEWGDREDLPIERRQR